MRIHQPREHQVPCQQIGCKALTFNWNALCDIHSKRCVICCDLATQTFPDKNGDPVHYCSYHKPLEKGAQ